MNRQVKVVFRPASEANFVQFFEDLNNLIIFEGFKMRNTVSLVPANRWNMIIFTSYDSYPNIGELERSIHDGYMGQIDATLGFS